MTVITRKWNLRRRVLKQLIEKSSICCMTGKKIVVHKHVSTQKCKIIMINIVAIMNTRNGIHYTSGRNRFRRKSTFESSCEEKTEKKTKNKNGLGLSSCCFNKLLPQLQKSYHLCFKIFSHDLKKNPKLHNCIICYMADVSDGKMKSISSKITLRNETNEQREKR